MHLTGSYGGGWTSGQHMLPDNYGYSRHPDCPPGGSSQSNRDGYYNPNCYHSAYENNHNFGHDYQSHSRPPYNNNNNNGLDWSNSNNHWNSQRRTKRSPKTFKPAHGGSATGNTVKSKITPPFNDDVIEAIMNVKPCQAYKFEIKITTPRNSVLGTIRDLRLPWLTEMRDFRPPDLSKVIQISKTGSLNMAPTSGIPSSCVKDFFTAVDNRMHHLEQDVLFHISQERQAHHNTYQWTQKLDNHKRKQLTADGCKCNSTLIHVNGTSKSSYQKFMGRYHFEGMFKVTHVFLVNIIRLVENKKV